MRWGALAWLGIVIAGCGGQGMELDVHSSDPAVKSVELFISIDDCTDPACHSGVAWSTNPAPAGRINVIYRDTSSTSDPAFLATVDPDGFARFQLQRAGDTTSVSRIAMVGYDDQHRPVAFAIMQDVTIPRSHAEYVHVELDPARQDASGETDPPGGGDEHRVHVWRRSDPALAACAALQSWDADQKKWVTEYFVPDLDTDCDDETIECDPYWYQFNKGQTASVCVAPITAPAAPAGACAVGTSLCVDGVSADPSCKLQTPLICLPDQICADCGTLLTASCLTQAIVTASQSDPSTMPIYDCIFTPDMANATDPTLPCTTQGTTSTDELVVPGAACSEAKLAVPGVPPVVPASTVMIGTTSFDVHKSSTAAGCTIDITWTSGSNHNVDGKLLLLVVSYPNNATIVLPVRIGFDAPTLCELTPKACDAKAAPPGEHVFSCGGP